MSMRNEQVGLAVGKERICVRVRACVENGFRKPVTFQIPCYFFRYGQGPFVDEDPDRRKVSVVSAHW